MDVLLAQVPPDDRTERRQLFPGLNEGTMRNALARASRAAGLPVYSPHDLRHRRRLALARRRMPARELAERMGHSKASMSLDVYTHVMPPDEAREKSLRPLLLAGKL
jgi:integrase